MKNIFLLGVAFICLSLIKMKHQNNTQLVRLDVRRVLIVDTALTLHIPLSLKFDDKVVNPEQPGLISLTVANKSFCYKRPVAYTRNEYFLDLKCSEDKRLVEVKVGDKIEFKFAKSNMYQAGNVPMYGEGEIL